MVPIESSVEGIVTATVDDLEGGGDVLIQAETRLPIEFALLAREGTTLADVKTVGGHPQAERSAGAGARPACPDANGPRFRRTRKRPPRRRR